MASTYLTRTQGTPTNTDIGTMSFWLKRSALDQNNHYIIQNYIDGSNYGYLRFKAGDTMQAFSASVNDEKRTTRLFRDTSAWYHVVLRVDTTQSTASDRVRLYINGVQETSFSPNSHSAQNADYDLFKSGGTMRIGYVTSGTATYFDGCLSHFHYCDGQSYAPTVFGETDSTTGEWKIIVDPTMTMGNQGFTILKNGNTITDQSSNSNNFTLGGGTLTKTEDNPSNVFATFNPLMHFRQPTPLLNGNTVIENGDAQWENGYGTIATPTTGKFYAEFKYPTFGGGAYGHAGIIAVDDIATQASGYLNFGDTANSWSISVTDGSVYNNGSSIATYSSISANGIIGLAIDCTNSKLYISVNGTWQNSANPSAGTGGISITSNKEYFVGGKVYNAYINANFGNGYFGTTAITSEGTNASGNGKFEYDVPSGFTALSTKGLNT
jgi:hypothetical protein